MPVAACFAWDRGSQRSACTSEVPHAKDSRAAIAKYEESCGLRVLRRLNSEPSVSCNCICSMFLLVKLPGEARPCQSVGILDFACFSGRDVSAQLRRKARRCCSRRSTTRCRTTLRTGRAWCSTGRRRGRRGKAKECGRCLPQLNEMEIRFQDFRCEGINAWPCDLV